MMIKDVHFITVKECDTLRDGFFFGPGVISSGTEPDWESCKRHCEDTTSATFFAWRKTDQKCFCKSSITGMQLSQPGWVSGKLHCYELLKDTAYTADVTGSYNENTHSDDLMPDWRSCKAHCEDNYPSAIVFVWKKQNEYCWCRTGYDGKRALVGLTSGKLGCGRRLQEGIVYNGIASYNLNNAFSDLMPDWPSCKEHCWNNYHDSKYFSWSESTQQCWCKSGFDSTLASADWTSGEVHCQGTLTW